MKNMKRDWLSVYYTVIYSCLYEYQQHKDNMNTRYPSSLTDSSMEHNISYSKGQTQEKTFFKRNI